jgi:hypothetical protein
VPAPDPVPSWFREKTPAPGARPAGFFRLGPPRRFITAPGAGEEAIVGGEEGGKGDGAAVSLESRMGRVGRSSCMEDVSAVAFRRACGGSLRWIMRDGRFPELRRDTGGEESISMVHANKNCLCLCEQNLKPRQPPSRS